MSDEYLAGVGLALGGPPVLAAVSPVVTGSTANLALQVLLHLTFCGLGFALVADLALGILMTAFYLWRRDLLANMLAHRAGLVFAMFTVVPPPA